MNKGMIINTKRQGHNSKCTVWGKLCCQWTVAYNIQNTHSVLSLTNGKRSLPAMNVVYDQLAYIL